MFGFKKLNVPSGTKELTAYESWAVRFEISRLLYSKEQCEFFTSEEDAKAFKQSVEQAAKLLKVDVSVSITKQ